MADSKVTKDVQEAMKSLGPLGKMVGRSAETLWKIFVRKYVAMGVAQLVSAAGILGISFWLLPNKSLWLFLSFGLAGIPLYCAINNLINPQYFAMDDVITHVQDVTKSKPVEVVQGGVASVYRGGGF